MVVELRRNIESEYVQKAIDEGRLEENLVLDSYIKIKDIRDENFERLYEKPHITKNIGGERTEKALKRLEDVINFNLERESEQKELWKWNERLHHINTLILHTLQHQDLGLYELDRIKYSLKSLRDNNYLQEKALKDEKTQDLLKRVTNKLENIYSKNRERLIKHEQQKLVYS